MKLLFNLSIILLSTGCLFAQTNQIKGCRKAESLSENQIRQGAETTTNHELRTTNCDNSAESLNCYLMMNPAVEGAEKAIESLIIGETRPSSSIISNRLGMRVGKENIVTCSLPHITTSLTISSNQNSKVSNEMSEDQREPTGTKNLGDYILALPAGIIGVFLRSPEEKQAFYKEKHEQAVQELQEKYPSLTYPELAQKIVAWKQTVEEWSECRFPKEKEARYQKVEALAADMPPELYHLVAFSQAMKIIEDAMAYTRYLPLAVEKYDKNTENLSLKSTESSSSFCTLAPSIDSLAPARLTPTGLLETSSRSLSRGLPTTSIPCPSSASATFKTGSNSKAYQAYLLAQLDTISNNIKKLEEAAEAVMRLSEQRNRCFAAAATVEAKENAKITEDLQSAVRTAEKAILSYGQFGQKMKEGNSTASYFSRIEGFFSECDALKQECRAQEAINEDNTGQWWNFNQVECYIETATVSLKNAVQARSEGQLEVAKAHEQVAQYNFQAAQAIVSGDSWDSLKVKIFSDAACQAGYVIHPLKDAAQARSEGQVEAAITYQQAAQYRCQLVQAIANGDSWDNSKVRSLPTASCQAHYVGNSLKDKAKAISEGQIKIAEVYEKKAQYYFQAVQAAVNGDSTKVNVFSNAAGKISNAVGPLKDAAQARSEGQVEVAIIYDQAAQYYLEVAEAVAHGDSTKEKNYSTAAEHTIYKADNLKHAILARNANQIEAAKAFDQAAQYYCRSVQFSINGDSANAENFSFLAKKTFLAARSLKNAYLARNSNQEEEAKTLDQAAQYYCRLVQCFIDGDNINAENFLFLAKNTSLAARSLKNASLARSAEQGEVAKAFNQAAQYYFQAVQASIEGDSIKTENFLHAGEEANRAGEIFKETTQATIHETQNFQVLSLPPYSRFQLQVLENDMIVEANFQTRPYAQSQEQVARYFLRKAEIYAQEGVEKGNAYNYSANRANS